MTHVNNLNTSVNNYYCKQTLHFKEHINLTCSYLAIVLSKSWPNSCFRVTFLLYHRYLRKLITTFFIMKGEKKSQSLPHLLVNTEA